MSIEAVIFDLDGVIVSTDEFHYRAWKELAVSIDIPFDRAINERLRGVSRMESLDIILEKARHTYCKEEKEALADAKNERYRVMLNELTPQNILPGILALLDDLSKRGIKIAIGSSSKNARFILSRIGLETRFDAVADGNLIRNSKPDPEVFLLAVEMMGIPAVRCAVIEDATAGIDAAIAAGCKAVAVGAAANSASAHYSVKTPGDIEIEELIKEI